MIEDKEKKQIIIDTANKILDIGDKIKELTKEKDDARTELERDVTGRQITALTKEQNELLKIYQRGGSKKSLEFALIIEKMRRAEPNLKNVKYFLFDIALKHGRYKEGGKDDNAVNKICIDGCYYVPTSKNDDKTPAQKLFEYELLRLYKEALDDDALSKV